MGRILLFLVAIHIFLFGNIEVVWQKRYGGDNYDEAYSIVATKDKGYILAGSTWSFGNGESDLYLLKIDKNGNKVWQKVYGKEGVDVASSIRLIGDNSYIIVGYTNSESNGGAYSILVDKIDKYGNRVWEKVIKYFAPLDYIGYSIVKSRDGGFLIVGKKLKNALLLKLDANGNKIKSKVLRRATRLVLYFIIPSNDGNYIACGYVYEDFDKYSKYKNAFVIKLSSNLEIIWKKSFIDNRAQSIANAAVATKDGGAIVVGEKDIFEGNGKDVYILRIDKEGNKIWEKRYGGKKDDIANAIIATKDGNFFIVGETSSFGRGKKDIYLLKIDKRGNLLWQKTLGGRGDDFGSGVALAKDGGYIVVGFSEIEGKKTDTVVFKIKESNEIPNAIVQGLYKTDDKFLAVRDEPKGELIGKLYDGDKLIVYEKRGKWYKIKRMADGLSGWSYYKWIKLLDNQEDKSNNKDFIKPSWCKYSHLNKTEQTICSDKELSSLDMELAKVYGNVKAKLNDKSQIKWLKKRNRCGNDKECIKKSYKERIFQLKNKFPNTSIKKDIIDFSNEYAKGNIKYVFKDNKLYLQVNIKNIYKDTKGGIFISFPNLEDKERIFKKYSVGFKEIKIIPKGDLVWNREYKRNIASSYLVAKAWSNYWRKYSTKRVDLGVDFSNKERVVVDIRAAFYRGKFLPKSSNIKDQQGYFVKRVDIK